MHCKAGLGRTGTLIAVCMMRSHGFTARAAMGRLRVMRPGSIIGAQQGFLSGCRVERIREAHNAACRVGPLSLGLPLPSAGKEVAGVVSRRWRASYALHARRYPIHGFTHGGSSAARAGRCARVTAL